MEKGLGLLSENILIKREYRRSLISQYYTIMNANLLSVQLIAQVDKRRNKYVVELSGVNKEDRKTLISLIEDRVKASCVEFCLWSREWKLFYNKDVPEFRMVPVLDIVLVAPFDMDPTGIGCFILSIIS